MEVALNSAGARQSAGSQFCLAVNVYLLSPFSVGIKTMDPKGAELREAGSAVLTVPPVSVCCIRSLVMSLGVTPQF